MSGEQTPISVMIVDDSRLARNELKRLLQDEDGISTLYEAADGHQALELIQKHQPDVLLLDIDMPGMTGFEMLEELDAVPVIPDKCSASCAPIRKPEVFRAEGAA